MPLSRASGRVEADDDSTRVVGTPSQPVNASGSEPAAPTSPTGSLPGRTLTGISSRAMAAAEGGEGAVRQVGRYLIRSRLGRGGMATVYRKEKDFNSAVPLMKRYPPEIKVHSTGFDLNVGRTNCGEGFGEFLGPKGKSSLSPDLLTYQRGVRNLNRHALSDAESEFVKSSRKGVAPTIRRASLIGLAETYRQSGKTRKSVTALSDYLEIAVNSGF